MRSQQGWHVQHTLRLSAGCAAAGTAAGVHSCVGLQPDELDAAAAAAGHAPPAGPADHPGRQLQRDLCQGTVWEPAGHAAAPAQHNFVIVVVWYPQGRMVQLRMLFLHGTVLLPAVG